MAESVADDPKLAALWDAGQNLQQARNVEARSFRPAVWEAASYFDDVKKFAAALAKLGFDVTTPSIEGAFLRICAIKNAKKPDAKLVLPFRGAAKGE